MPKASELIAAAVRYLDDELMSSLTGYHRFKTRVTINALNIVRRELEMSAAHEAAERERLTAILGHIGAVEDLSRELCDRIRAGEIDINNPALRDHVRRSLAEALAINNPKWTGR